MALPTGSFQSAYPGTLVVTLTSKFNASSYRTPGFPSSGGSAGGTNIAIKGYAGPSGSPVYSGIVDKFNLVSVFELEYPGGNAAWGVGVVFVGNVVDMTGIYSYSMTDVKLSCKLRKK